MTSSTQTKASAHYAAASDAAYGTDDWESGRHRASQTEAVDLELAQVRARLDKLRQRMRSALSVRTAVGLGLAAAVLIALAVLSLVSFVNRDSGLGLLLGGAFVAGVPLAGAATIRAGQTWWRLSHEAALLRQREAELHARWDRAVVGSEAPRPAPDTSDDDSERFWRAASTTRSSASSPHQASSHQADSYRARSDSGYGLPGRSWPAGSDPLSGYSATSAPLHGSDDDSEALHLAEYSALSPSSHVLARAMRDSLGTPPTSTPTFNGADSYQNSQLPDIASPRQPEKRRGVARTDPSWWSPTGLHARATQHATPAEPGPPPIGGWGVLLAIGVTMTLFAMGVILGVLTSA